LFIIPSLYVHFPSDFRNETKDIFVLVEGNYFRYKSGRIIIIIIIIITNMPPRRPIETLKLYSLIRCRDFVTPLYSFRR